MNVLIITVISHSYLSQHSLHLIYRDLKSSNVLLDEDMSVKLADLGSARGVARNMTKMGGTPAWMAPELFFNQQCR